MKPKAYVIKGLGIGCHEEVAHAFEKAGADTQIVHYRRLLEGGKDFLFRSQILNASGGFFHGDIPEAGLGAANELEHSGIKDAMVEYAGKGNVIYGQCNGFQLLVKTGLLPGIDGDYSKQTVTLTGNDYGNYLVTFAPHRIEEIDKRRHFAFEDIDDSDLRIVCRHGEGKIQFNSEHGLVPEEEGKRNRERVNREHVIMRYVHPVLRTPTQGFPHNPNGSVDAIAGLADYTGNIFGHMAHTEVGIYLSRHPEFFRIKERWRRQGIKAEDIDDRKLEGICLKVFENIVNRVRQA